MLKKTIEGLFKYAEERRWKPVWATVNYSFYIHSDCPNGRPEVLVKQEADRLVCIVFYRDLTDYSPEDRKKLIDDLLESRFNPQNPISPAMQNEHLFLRYDFHITNDSENNAKLFEEAWSELSSALEC